MVLMCDVEIMNKVLVYWLGFVEFICVYCVWVFWECGVICDIWICVDEVVFGYLL